jgi:hypothetical protein
MLGLGSRSCFVSRLDCCALFIAHGNRPAPVQCPPQRPCRRLRHRQPIRTARSRTRSATANERGICTTSWNASGAKTLTTRSQGIQSCGFYSKPACILFGLFKYTKQYKMTEGIDQPRFYCSLSRYRDTLLEGLQQPATIDHPLLTPSIWHAMFDWLISGIHE